MTIKRNALPPLDTLVFFDCVMRHGSFTQAASELHVTQAAVSKRIRQLEEWLGLALFIRDKPRLTPTVAADSLHEKVGVTLEFLAQGLEAVRAPDDPPVNLAAMGAVSMFWLQPRLRAFALGETACPINLTTTDHPRDLIAPAHDLTVLYGDGQFPGRRAQLLFSETLAPMAAPGAETKNLPLLGYPLRGPDWIGWDKWHSQTGHGALADHPRLPCASYAQSVGRALQGDGIVLGSLPLLQDEVQHGTLTTLPGPRLTTGKGYYLTMPQGSVASENAARLWAFLTS
mgnify:CR=1 FL=1